MSKSSNGHAVYQILSTVKNATKYELGFKTGLSPAQVESGLRQIREVLGAFYNEPIAYSPHLIDGRQFTYALAKTEKAAQAYLIYRVGIMVRQMHNLNVGTAGPAAVKFNSPALDVIRFSIEQIENQLTFAKKQLAKL